MRASVDARDVDGKVLDKVPVLSSSVCVLGGRDGSSGHEGPRKEERLDVLPRSELDLDIKELDGDRMDVLRGSDDDRKVPSREEGEDVGLNLDREGEEEHGERGELRAGSEVSESLTRKPGKQNVRVECRNEAESADLSCEARECSG